MKKLMIVAVAAAMAGVASAAVCSEDECGVGAGYTAYKLVVSLKTTVAKPVAKYDKDTCADTCVYYYTQKTQKLAGYAYGEAECSGCQMLGDDLQLVAWNATTKESLAAPELALYLGRYEKKGTKAEAYGALSWTNDIGDNSIALAGFGAMYISGSQKNEECVDDCYTFIKNLAGNAAGYLARETGNICDEGCELYGYSCCAEEQEPAAAKAASGTWKLVYDKSVAKKLATGKIAASQLCPSYVNIEEDAGEVVIEE